MDLKNILRISKSMNVEIEDSDSGKHYIKDKNGNRVEFNTDMIMFRTNKSSDVINKDVELIKIKKE